MAFNLTPAQALLEKKELCKKHLKGIALNIELGNSAGKYHLKVQHNDPEKFAALYGCDVDLVNACIQELTDEGVLE